MQTHRVDHNSAFTTPIVWIIVKDNKYSYIISDRPDLSKSKKKKIVHCREHCITIRWIIKKCSHCFWNYIVDYCLFAGKNRNGTHFKNTPVVHIARNRNSYLFFYLFLPWTISVIRSLATHEHLPTWNSMFFTHVYTTAAVFHPRLCSLFIYFFIFSRNCSYPWR